MKTIKKAIILAFVAQFAVLGASTLAMDKQCGSCSKNSDGSYTCSDCI